MCLKGQHGLMIRHSMQQLYRDITIHILREGYCKPVLIGSSICRRSVTLGFLSSCSSGNLDHYVSLIAAGIVRAQAVGNLCNSTAFLFYIVFELGRRHLRY